MKKITLQIGLTFVLLVLAGTAYGQTPVAVPNLVRLLSLNTVSGGTSSTVGSIISQDDSAITISATGVVTIATDYTPTYGTGNTTTTGNVSAADARDKTINVRLSAGSVINQTAGVDFGAIDTALNTGGISRNSDGSIGITTDGNASGVDFGEGFNFGLDLTNLPSKYSVEISGVSFSAFAAPESCTIVNRQNTSRTVTFNGTSSGIITRNISALGILIPGGTSDFDAVSIFNSSSPDAPWRITGIEFRIVENAASNVIILTSLTGGSATLPNGTSSTSTTNFFTSDDSNIAIDANGFVTIESDFNRTATQTEGGATFTTGNVQIGGARGKTIAIRMSAGNAMNTTDGSDLGAITTAGAFNRASDGGIGVATIAAPTTATGIDNNEGLTFGLDVSSLPSTVAVQVVKVHFSTFATAETCRVVNRQNTSNNQTVSGFGSNAGVTDISGLGISIQGGSAGFQEVVSFYNNSPAAQNFRITGIELRIAALSTLWNGTAWSNGNPGPAVDAIIEGNYSALAKGGFSAKTLTVNSGSLVIEDTKNLKIEFGVVNNAGPSGIIVEQGGTLQQVQSTGLNSGAITVKKNSNLLFRNDYTMWSSPVTGATTLEQFSPLTAQTPNNRFYVYNPTSNLYENVAPSSSFNIAKGYLIRMPNENPADLGTSSAYYTGAAAINFSGTVVGVPNNGTLTLTGLATDSFHATGNPYPSNLDADLFLGGNTTGGTLYFWRKTNGAVGTAYATYTLAGGVANGGFPAPTKIIAPCQGFIVKTGVGISSLTFTNAMRPNNAVAGQFLKTREVATKDRVWLKLSNTSGTFNQALIAYMDGATTGVDNGIDGEYINDSKVALTSSINAAEYVIQGRPAFDATDVVALNFKTDVAGDFSISLDQFDGVFATGQAVYLVDSKTGIETDLKSGGYNFNAAAGVDNSRFTLKYQKTLKLIDAEFNENSIAVYGKNGSLFIKSSANAISTIRVFDIQGRLLAEQKNVKSTAATVSNLKPNQALIVQVSSEDNQVVTKKVLN